MPEPKRTTGLDELLTLVSSRVGVIRNLERLPHGIALPDPPVVYNAVLAHHDFRRARLRERSASGKGETEEEAMAGAIGEAVERYCASHPYPESVIQGTFSALPGEALDPAALILYSEAQYAGEGIPFGPFGEDTILSWVPATSLPGGSTKFVPATFVYMNYACPSPEQYLADPTTNGLAAGPDLTSAILSGLYELIERDGFLIHWCNRLGAPRVDLEGLGGIFRSIPEHFRRFGVEVSAHNVSSDVAVPVMLALSIDGGGRGPAACVGLGCHLSPTRALRKALFELCQSYLGQSNQMRRPGYVPAIQSFADVHEPEDHGALFRSVQSLRELGFLLEGDRLQRVENLPDRSTGSAAGDLETCLGLLAPAGIRAAYVDVTTPDIRPLGLRVVRTIAPGLQPMHFGFGRERRGGRRLYETPQALGYAVRPRTESELNPCPHPLD
jgi:ribosomal protein S12 methylthiotransferase accessory factor